MNDDNLFLQIIDATPLVSIDLVLEDSQGRVLLGHRINRPAQGYWFVPGGRIRKNETRTEALHRISFTELGIRLNLSDARLIGAFDHIYPDNFFGVMGINTHYVVLAYHFFIADDVVIKPDNQHSGIQWWNKDDLLADSSVHENTKAYFIGI